MNERHDSLIESEPADARLPEPAEEALRVTGTARLLLVINLSNFVQQDDRDLFRHIRGSEAFTNALRDLQPGAPFFIDTETQQIESEGYELRIFRSRLRYNHFFPTYRVVWDAVTDKDGDIARWREWEIRIRISRNGLAVITLDRPLDDLPLIRCTELLLELPPEGQGNGQDQWSLGMAILRLFLNAIDCRLLLELPGGSRAIRFTTTEQFKHTIRLDRYIIYFFRCIRRGDERLRPDDLKREYPVALASFMEGALVEHNHHRRYPRYAIDRARALVDGDVSSWDEELCLFTGESALIYCPLLDGGLAYVGGPRGLQAHAYHSYWAGIVRGIEHMVAFRSEVQQAERRTTDLLNRIPMLTRDVNDGNLSTHDIALIEHLAAGLSDIFDSLPEQRSMAVSSIAFRADYVRHKFEVLMRELKVAETLDLVNTNVEQLNFFLSYYNDMRLQWQGQRTNSLGILLGVVVMFMAASSFLADTFNVLAVLTNAEQDEKLAVVRNLGIAIALGFVATVALVVVARRLRKRFNRRARWPGLGGREGR